MLTTIFKFIQCDSKPNKEKCRQMILKNIKLPNDKGYPIEGEKYRFVIYDYLQWNNSQKRCEKETMNFIKSFNDSHMHNNIITCKQYHRISNDFIKIEDYMEELGYKWINTIKYKNKIYFQWSYTDCVKYEENW